jgi:hypothetical protein
MSEHTVILCKKSGGSSLTGPDGKTYTWAKDGQGVEVPYVWGMELLGIPDGGFWVEGDPVPAAVRFDGEPVSVQTVAQAGLEGSEEHAVTGTATLHTAGDDDGDEDEDAEVTEPAPEGKHAITEPAPPPKHPASPITPKTQAGTKPRR